MELKSYRRPAILIVENEVILRMDLADIIQDAGFPTFEADGADEAIQLMEAHPDIQVLFTDVDMPGTMDGLKLAHYVRGRWPPVRIVITSGHVLLTADQMPVGSRFISKPHQGSDLQSLFRMIEDGCRTA